MRFGAFAACRRRGAAGGGGATLTAPVITKTSATGHNPMSWDSTYTDLRVDDVIRLTWTKNGVASQETHTVTSDDVIAASDPDIGRAWAWAAYAAAAASFVGGDVVTVKEDQERTGSTPSPYSNVISDTVPATVTGINRGVYDINGAFGGGPFTKTGVAIAGGGKIVLTVAFWANPLGGQSLTSITANSGAITFTRVAGIAATANKQIWYADVAGGVANLDLTFNVGGSTELIDFSVDELSNAAAGGPSSTYIAEISTSAVDGGLVVPTAPSPGLGIIGLYVNASATFTGATKQAEGAADGEGQRVSVSYLTATGAVTVAGPSGNRWVINSAWTHA